MHIDKYILSSMTIYQHVPVTSGKQQKW